MNKNMALTIVGVILLGMVLVIYNEYSNPEAPKSAITETQVEQSSQTAQANIEPSKETQPTAEKAVEITPPAATNEVEDWSNNEPLAPTTPSPIALAAPTEPAKAPAEVEQTQPAVPVAPKAPEPVPAVEPVKAKEEQKTAPEATKQAEVQKTVVEEKPTEPKKPVAAKKAPSVKAIDKISILSIGDGVTVRIDSNQSPMYKAMQLKSPDRIVVDLTGTWKVKAPGVPKNEFVTNVRIGEQKDGTRIVIDLKKTPASIRYLKYGDTGLDVRVR